MVYRLGNAFEMSQVLKIFERQIGILRANYRFGWYGIYIFK